MAQTRTLEILVGAFAAAGLAALFFLGLQVSSLGAGAPAEGYRLTARFADIGSLKERSPVTMAGVRIGRVAQIGFDRETYQAVVILAIDEGLDVIPEDTYASIHTAGLLGEQYVALSPGGSEVYLRDGDELLHTQSALILEQVIGQLLFSTAEEGSE